MENLTSSPPRVENEEFSEKVSPQAFCFSPGVASFTTRGEPAWLAVVVAVAQLHFIGNCHSPFSEKATKGCYTFLHGEAILLAPFFPHSPFSDLREGVTTLTIMSWWDPLVNILGKKTHRKTHHQYLLLWMVEVNTPRWCLVREGHFKHELVWGSVTIPLHTQDWGSMTIPLQAFSLVKRWSQSKFTSHYTWSSNGVSGCKMDRKSTWIPIWIMCFMVKWIIFRNHLLEIGLTQNQDSAWIEIHWRSIWLRAPSHMTSTFYLRARDHTIAWFWKSLETAFGHVGALHTMAEGQEAVNFHQSNCKKPRVQPLDPSHYGQRPSQFKMIAFRRRRRTLEGSLSRTGMETQTMVERSSVFFIKESNHWQDLGH
jgi:hypothetical protein